MLSGYPPGYRVLGVELRESPAVSRLLGKVSGVRGLRTTQASLLNSEASRHALTSGARDPPNAPSSCAPSISSTWLETSQSLEKPSRPYNYKLEAKLSEVCATTATALPEEKQPTPKEGAPAWGRETDNAKVSNSLSNSISCTGGPGFRGSVTLNPSYIRS